MRTTLISHFWNEEYLLPWWIKHHREMFDDAVLIDWESTDRSRKAFQKYAPSSWKVVDTKHKLPIDDDKSYAMAVDEEVMWHEEQVEGWRMCLNTTEFLIGDMRHEISKPCASGQHLVGCIAMHVWKPEGVLDQNMPLWEQEWMGLECRCGSCFNERPARSLHNRPERYSPGRHYWNLSTDEINNKLVILHYSHCIASPQMLKRRLQIQERITRFGKKNSYGVQHYGGGTLFPSDVMAFSNSRRSHSKDVRPIIAWLNGGGEIPERNPLCSEEDWRLLHPNTSAQEM